MPLLARAVFDGSVEPPFEQQAFAVDCLDSGHVASNEQCEECGQRDGAKVRGSHVRDTREGWYVA